MAKIVEMCAVLKVLLEAKSRGELMMAPEIGERIGMTAQYAGPLLGIMYERKLVEKPEEGKKRYQISPKGEGFLANPPPETEVKKKKPPAVPPVPPPPPPPPPPPATPPPPPPPPPPATPPPPPPTSTDKEKVVFPSQADTFSSIGETLGFEKGVGDQKKPSLESVVEYVRRLANMDDLDSIESVLTECGLSADIRKRWLRLYALTLPAKKAIISPELKVRLGLEEGGEKLKSPQPMYNVIEGKIYPDPDGEYTFSKAVQLVAAGKTSADPASLITAIMPILTKEPSTDSAALITALMPLLNKEPPPPQDTTLFQSLQTRIEQLADERNKANLDALRAEIKSGQRPPEADAQILALTKSIETLREENRTQQLERIKEQHEAALSLLADKFTRLEQQIKEGILGKQVDSKYGLMSEGLKGILNEIGGARRDIKDIAPTFLQRREQTVRTPEQKANFDKGIEEAIEKRKKSMEMGDELFAGKEG